MVINKIESELKLNFELIYVFFLQFYSQNFCQISLLAKSCDQSEIDKEKLVFYLKIGSQH